MLSCDYNGWADMREDEREAIDTFEASLGSNSWVRIPVRSGALSAAAVQLPLHSSAR
jgi:hypothetical protein